jgi:Flp pilus assembly protein TadG
MKNTDCSVLKRFMHDSKGSVAMLFGLSLLPILAGTGVAIDYSRASNSRQAFQSAADAAALAGAKARSVSDAEAEKVAKQVFDANLKMSGYTGFVVPTIKFIDKSGLRVTGNTKLANTFLPIVGIKNADVSYNAEANLAAATAGGCGCAGDEIALVLDNTGSMSKDMQALRDASIAFVDKAMVGKTKISVVPFVTAVNVGSSNLTMSQLDTQANSKWHGAFVRELVGGTKFGTPWQPYNVAETIGGCIYIGGGGGGGGGGPGSGGSGASLDYNKLSPEEILRSIFGISTAHAQATNVTPNTVSPLSGTTVMSNGKAKSPKNVFVPTGFTTYDNNCYLETAKKVSHFDLLARMPNAKWKGCVEARPEPFDVTDEPPTSGQPNSLYVPYFWPDEHDPLPNYPLAYNNYMSDGTLPAGWDYLGYPGARTSNILKYDGKNVPKIVETAPDTMGPNRACPSELKRLTNDKAAVKNTLQNMQHWNGGGTILVEGLAWGWRTLSPQAPFADGKPYDKDAKKTIVFMSDGDNEMGDAANTQHYSHYTSYGYLANGRFPDAKFAVANNYLDQRFLLACKNAKAKGIKIITILFRNKQGNSVDMMKQCASTPADAYFAGNQTALKKTFDSIAGSFSESALKLTK